MEIQAAQKKVFKKLIEGLVEKVCPGVGLERLEEKHYRKLRDATALGITSCKEYVFRSQGNPKYRFGYRKDSVDKIAQSLDYPDFEKFVDQKKEELELGQFETDDLIYNSRQRKRLEKDNSPLSPSRAASQHIFVIREMAPEGNQLTLEVSLNQEVLDRVILTIPIVHPDLQWYYEKYLDEPYESKVRAKACKMAVCAYGQALFDQLFGDQAPSAITEAYTTLVRKRQLSDLDITIRTRSRLVDEMLWETLWDRQHTQPLSVRGVNIFREVSSDQGDIEYKQPSDVIHVLLVTAREIMHQDIDYRTVQAPIVQMVEGSPFSIHLHILRPGTFSAFRKHLQDKKMEYHLVHFDMHGAVLTYEALTRKKKEGLIKYYKAAFKKGSFFVRDGADEIEAYKGQKAFLFFEDENEQKMVPYEASELAAFLKESGIPVCFLNACQSAMAVEGNSQVSLGQTFAKAGMHAVVAMRQSVSVSAVLVMVRAFYEYLLVKNYSVMNALTGARQELFNDKERSAQFDLHISLEDWSLPVVYFNKTVPYDLKSVQPLLRTLPGAGLDSAQLIGHQKEELIGRDLDILRIERALLSKGNQLRLRGLKGVGKSALLTYLAKWWKQTNFIEKAWTFHYQSTPLTLNLLVETLTLYFEDHTNQDLTKLQGAQQQEVLLKFLNTQRYALFFHQLNEPGALADDLLDFLSHIRKSLVLYESSGHWEESIEPSSLTNVYRLKGLDESSAFRLARQVLWQHELDLEDFLERDRPGFTSLIRELQGMSASFFEQLPKLSTMPAGQVRAEMW